MKYSPEYDIIKWSKLYYKAAVDSGRLELYMNLKKILKISVPAITSAAVASFSALTAFAEDSSASSAKAQSGGGITMIISLVVMLGLLYFLMIRPQRKKEKESKEMQDNIQIGDEIVTIGGIVGLVVRRGDDNVVIETGGERNKMRIKLWAISENTSALERAKAAQDKKAQEKGMAVGGLKEEKSSKKQKKADKEEK